MNSEKGISEEKFTLTENLDGFDNDKIFISSFLNGLWNTPEAISHILENSDPQVVKTNLAPFICQ